MRRRAPWLLLGLLGTIGSAGYALLLGNLGTYTAVTGGGPLAVAIEQGVYFFIFFAGWALVGALIAARRPHNAVGWILLAGSGLTGMTFFSEQYAIHGLVTAPGSLPAAEIAAWPSAWGWVPGIMLLTVVMPLVFPTGRPPSPRWRPVAWFIGLALVLATVAAAFAPTSHGQFPEVANPYALLPEGWAVIDSAVGVFFLASIGAVIASLVVRFRHANAIERQQLKWFLTAIVVAAAGAIAPIFGSGPVADALEGVVLPLGLGAVPASIAVAILRHRLFDIDLVIRRTLTYGALTAVLAALYVGGVLALSQPLSGLTGGDQLAVAASTLAAAAAFRPARRRIQATVDRRFYRSRYDAARTVEAFGQRLRDELELAALEGEVLAVIETTLRPTMAALWLRQGERR